MTAVVLAAGAFGLTGFFWYRFFYRREKNLLDRLLTMIRQAENGTMHLDEISEEKLSLLENRLKRFLDDSLLETDNQKQQKKVIQELISDIAHQTITPVTNLKLYAELLCEDPARNAECAQTIREEAERLDFLIQSLTALSRMETGIIEVRPKKADVQTLFAAVRNEYEQAALQKNIRLGIKDTPLQAAFDLKWTKEALGNIVDNAIKYTHPGGTVTVCATACPSFVRIDVTDNGIGIVQEECARIFTRFYRSPAVSEQPGVGIGLYLAREIIKAGHGYVKVRSEENAGSVFSVFLPVSQSIPEP